MAALYTLNIPKESDLHRRLAARIDSRVNMAIKSRSRREDAWRKAEDSALAYIKTSDVDAARKREREVSGKPGYVTMTIPYSYALLMSMHTYLTSVFFARDPIHQFKGLHGEAEQQVQAVEALIAYQVELGEMMGPYYIWLYDAAKYGQGILGQYWCEEVIHYGEFVEMVDPNNLSATPVVMQATHEVPGYQGNKVFNVSPWDFIWDPRFTMMQFQQGEFCGRRVRLGWNEVVKRQEAGYYMNIDELKQGSAQSKKDSEPSSALDRPDSTNWNLTDEVDKAGKKIERPATVDLWEFHVELIPYEWGVGSTKFPQKWVFTCTEDRELIIGACPLGYMHAKFPFDIAEIEIEGYGVANRGVSEIMEPIQNTMDWLINSHFYNVRTALNNQFIVDPTKIVIKDVENGGPGFLWRLRPEAYGDDIRKFFMQVPVTDVTRSHIGDIQTLNQIGERVLGINDQIMGALSQGGRKTATEVRTSTGFGVNRMKTISEYISGTAFSAHARKLVITSQQRFSLQGKLRIVGDLALTAGPSFIDVSPQAIQGFFGLVPVDGTLPIDRMAQANLWKELLGLFFRAPALAQGFDLNKLIAWTCQLAGLKNINQFRVEVAPDAALAAAAQQGNVIPIRPGGGPGVGAGSSASTASGLPTLLPPPSQQVG